MFRRNKIKMLPNFGGNKKPIIVEPSKKMLEDKYILPSSEELPTDNKVTENISEIKKEIPSNALNEMPMFPKVEKSDSKIPETDKSNLKENISCTNIVSQKDNSDVDDKSLMVNTLKENICASTNNCIINKPSYIAKTSEKIAARRTKIKSQPIIHSVKRPTSISVKDNKICDTNNVFLNKLNSSSLIEKTDTIPLKEHIKNELLINNNERNNKNNCVGDIISSNTEQCLNFSNISTNIINHEDDIIKDVNDNKDNALSKYSNSANILNGNVSDSAKSLRNKRNEEQTAMIIEEKDSNETSIKYKTESTKIRPQLENSKPPAKKLKSVLREKMPVELPKGKKSFLERKQKYRNKLSTGGMERNEMTMFDLIYWNPASNPMPGNQNDEPGSRSRSNTLDDRPDVVTVAVEEQNVEEEGLQVEANKDNNSADTDNVVNADDVVNADNVVNDRSENVENNVHDQLDSSLVLDSDEESSTLAPQVKIGPNGELIVDEKSLVIQTTAAKNRDKVMSTAEVIEESNDTSHYGKWSKRRKRSTEWTRKETARFYKALSTVGTDFSLMETIFAWRSRQELKIKFKKEEKINRHLIDTALNDCTQFDFSIFDESDYDPEADRKESKEAEKAEAKRKKEVEREHKKLEKEKEKREKREQEKLDKLRKKKLKSAYNKRKRRKCNVAQSENEPRVPKNRRHSTISVETQEVICEVVFSSEEQIEKNYTVKEGDDDDHIPKEPTVFGNDSIQDNLINEEDLLSVVTEENEGMGIQMDQSNVQIVDMGEDEVIAISQSSIPDEENQSFHHENYLLNTNKKTTFSKDNNSVYEDVISDSSFVNIEKSSEGKQFLKINTAKGLQKIPVPPYATQSSNIVVMATTDPENPSEQIYHVYAVAPVAPTGNSPPKLSNNIDADNKS